MMVVINIIVINVVLNWVFLFCLDSSGLFSWLIAFLAQLNPLFGPEVKNDLAAHMRRAWQGYNETDNKAYPCELVTINLTATMDTVLLSIGYPNW